MHVGMDLYCSIFVQYPGTHEGLEGLVRALPVWQEPDLRAILAVDSNDYKKGPVSKASQTANWLHYEWVLELRFDEIPPNLERAIRAVTAAVRGLKSAGFDAVPSCDYEDQLPEDVRWVARAEDQAPIKSVNRPRVTAYSPDSKNQESPQFDPFCLKCGYCLHGVTERCPECGTPFDLHDPRSFHDPDSDERGPLERLAVAGALAILGSLATVMCLGQAIPGLPLIGVSIVVVAVVLELVVCAIAAVRMLDLRRRRLAASRSIRRAWLVSLVMTLLFGLFFLVAALVGLPTS